MNTTMQEDLNAAKHLLRTHGFAFKIFGEEDVRRVLRERDENLTDSNKARIVEHVMQGDDWASMSEILPEEEANIHAIINGTEHDHPEWFQSRDDFLEEKARDWMYRHGQAILDDMADDIMEEQEVSREEALEIIELIERAELTIKF
jgi:hypothetical protein